MTVAGRRGTERIARAFARAKAERRLAVLIYHTVGYPDRASTPALLRAALEPAHAIADLAHIRAEHGSDLNVLVCLSGRGDKDLETVMDALG